MLNVRGMKTVPHYHIIYYYLQLCIAIEVISTLNCITMLYMYYITYA